MSMLSPGGPEPSKMLVTDRITWEDEPLILQGQLYRYRWTADLPVTVRNFHRDGKQQGKSGMNRRSAAARTARARPGTSTWSASEFRVLAFLGGDEVGIISSYLTSS